MKNVFKKLNEKFNIIVIVCFAIYVIYKCCNIGKAVNNNYNSLYYVRTIVEMVLYGAMFGFILYGLFKGNDKLVKTILGAFVVYTLVRNYFAFTGIFNKINSSGLDKVIDIFSLITCIILFAATIMVVYSYIKDDYKLTNIILILFSVAIVLVFISTIFTFFLMDTYTWLYPVISIYDLALSVFVVVGVYRIFLNKENTEE